MLKHLIVLLLFCSTTLSSQELITYPVPKQLLYSAHNDDFTVLVRQKGGEWKDLYEYKVQVDMDNVQNASMVSFDFTGKVEVLVKKNNGFIQKVDIRPKALEIDYSIDQNNILFELDKPLKLSLEVNGDKLHNLHVFANPILAQIDKNNPDLIYFGPGVHSADSLPNNAFNIPSNKTVFIDGAAVLKGKLLVENANNVNIIGHGIIYHPERGVEIKFSKNVSVNGPIFINPKHYAIYGGQSRNIEIKNIKSFSCRGWSDGIDLMSCSDVNIDGVFMRNSDDCIAIYGHRWDFYGNAKNIKVLNSTLWSDIAHPTNIGLHGDAEAGGDTIDNVLFENIDILEHDEDDRNYQGCLAISAGDNNLVKNITYRDIRIESIQEGMLFNFRVYYNEKYCKYPGRGIENVSVENLFFYGTYANPSIIEGYEGREVQNVSFKNIQINGEKQKQLSDIGHQGKHVNAVSFK